MLQVVLIKVGDIELTFKSDSSLSELEFTMLRNFSLLSFFDFFFLEEARGGSISSSTLTASKYVVD